jgi:hypothetical protein
MDDHGHYIRFMSKEQTEKQETTLVPVNDPQYRGVFIVPAYREYRQLLRRVERNTNGEGKRPAFK